MSNSSDKGRKRDLIINSALNVFSRKGISETSIRDIANEADIPKGTIYEYFASKDEIISEAIFGSVGLTDSVMDDIVEQAKTNPVLAMDDFIEKNAEIVYKDADKLQLITQYLLKSLFEKKSDISKVKKDYMSLTIPYIERLKEIIGYGINKGFMNPREELEDVCYIVAFMLRSFSTYGYSRMKRKELNRLIHTVKQSIYYILGISESNIRPSD